MKISRHNKTQSGFTLIELLVVISIIGLLSTVIIAALGSSRNRGVDASIKQDMASIRSQAEIYYNSNSNSYGTITSCSTGVFSDTEIVKMVNQINVNAPSAPTCNGTEQTWAISTPLKASSGKYWCVDSAGSSIETSTASPTNGVCPTS